MSQKQKAKKVNKEQKKPKQIKHTNVQSGSFEKVLLFSVKTLLILAFVSPLIVVSDFFFPFVGPKSMVFMGIVQLMFALYLLLAIYFPVYRPKFNIVTISLFAFFGVLVLTSLTGVSFLRSFWSNYERMTGLLMWFHLIAFYIALTSVLKTKQDWSLILFSTLFFSVIVAAVFLLVRFEVIYFPLSLGGSTIGNSSFMGGYLLFNAFIAVYLFIVAKRYARCLALLLFLPVIAALYFSDARASRLSFIIALVLLFFIYLAFMPRKKHIRIVGIFVISSFVIAIVVFSIFLFIPDSIVQEMYLRFDHAARITVWAVAWRGFLERPLLGWGIANFDAVYIRHFDPKLILPVYGGEVIFDSAHNIVFDTMISAGALGILTYIFIFVAVFYHLLKLILLDKKNFWLSGIAAVTLIAYFMQNLTVFDMINSYIMFMLIIGYAAASPLDVKIWQPEKQLRKASLLFAPGVIIAFAAVFFVFTYSPWQANVYFAKTSNPQTLDQLLHFYGRAINSSPLGRDKVRLALANQFTVLATSEKGRQADRVDLDRIFYYMEGELQKNVNEYPNDYVSYLDFASFYNRWAQYNPAKARRAVRLIDRAIELGPKFPFGYWVMAQTHAILGERDIALNAAQKAVELEPRHLRSHEVAIKVAVEMGRLDIAEEKLIQALEVNPEWEAHLRIILPK